MSPDIVVPTHNHEQRIDRTLRAYRAGPPQLGVRIHVTLDGRTDRTADIVRAHAAVDERIISNEFPTPASPTPSAPRRRADSLDLLPYDDTQCGAKVIHLRVTE